MSEDVRRMVGRPHCARLLRALHAMSVVHANQDTAAKWLMERRDLAERRETIGMIMNAALLVFIAWTILLGVINLFRGVHALEQLDE
jgi:hypothetical protein